MSKYHFPGGRIYPSSAGLACARAKGTHEQTLSKKTACEVIHKTLQLLLDFSAKVQLLVENTERSSAALPVSHEMVDLHHSYKRMSPGLWKQNHHAQGIEAHCLMLFE